MTTWLAIIGVGLVSYLFRAVPVLVLGRVRISDRVDRTIRHAGAAALTALLVGAVQHWDSGGLPVAVIGATTAALVMAMRGASVLRVVVAGTLVYATIAGMGAIAW